MPVAQRSIVYDWLRHDKQFPHVWCPGCGLGIVLGSLIRALIKSGLSKNEVVLVSGPSSTVLGVFWGSRAAMLLK